MSSPGGERSQIAQIAIEVADKIFPAFGWLRRGTKDHNFLGVPITSPAQNAEENDDSADAPTQSAAPAARSEDSATAPALVNYPADGVYSYSDPYFAQTSFIHFDFKSYADATIKPSTLRKDLQNLADVVSVAETSADWSAKFAPEEKNYNVFGGLFVHNHDEKALERFNTYLGKLTSSSVRLAQGKRLYLFTPARILYLNSIVADIAILRGNSVLPVAGHGEIFYFYPYGVRYKPLSNLLPYASAEMLLGPLLILRYRFDDNKTNRGYVVYYDGPGAESEEFIYIFEALLKRHLMTGEDKIKVRLMNAAPNCALVFNKAKEEFIQTYHDIPLFRALLDTVEYGRVDMAHPKYSSIELGAR